MVLSGLRRYTLVYIWVWTVALSHVYVKRIRFQLIKSESIKAALSDSFPLAGERWLEGHRRHETPKAERAIDANRLPVLVLTIVAEVPRLFHDVNTSSAAQQGEM